MQFFNLSMLQLAERESNFIGAVGVRSIFILTNCGGHRATRALGSLSKVTIIRLLIIGFPMSYACGLVAFQGRDQLTLIHRLFQNLLHFVENALESIT